MAPGVFTSHQASLLERARLIFIVEQLIIFPLYYLPGLRGRLGGDVSPRFPCSISWMTRKGLPRAVTLVLWCWGWALMVRAYFMDGDASAMRAHDWWRAAFMLQMFGTGFVAVVVTPMKGADVALGAADKLHCYAAMLYVFDHVIADVFVLGVSNAYLVAFVAASAFCGVCQLLRTDGDRRARQLYVRAFGARRLSLATFLYVLELAFMASENALFLIFLVGMNSGVRVVG